MDGKLLVGFEKILAPMVLGKKSNQRRNLGFDEKVRGNRMAKAAIETAVWDLEAKKLNVPLWKHLGRRAGEIECGVSIGIQDSVEQLFEKIQTELDAGYQTHQNQNRAALGLRSYQTSARTFRRYSFDGRREFGLHARRY
jgi:L-alanine-DL-glutamate epimerase-like enolase superfamily enzyme